MNFFHTLFFFVFLNAYSQNNSVLEEIKGNPKEYKETWYEAKKTKTGFVKGKYLHDDVYIKDSNGEFMKQSFFPMNKWDFPQNRYNDKKQKLETINYYDDGGIINRTEFFYDKNKVVQEKFYYNSDTIISSVKYEYQNDLIIKKLEFDAEKGILSDNPQSVITYKYDGRNNMIKESHDSNFQNDVFSYVYNDKNFMTEFYRKLSFPVPDKESKLSMRFEYKNYDLHNWTEIYVEDDIDSDKKSKCYFIQREFKY
jgi:hypothetical protein